MEKDEREALAHEAASRVALEIMRKNSSFANKEKDAEHIAKIYNKAYGVVFEYVKATLDE